MNKSGCMKDIPVSNAVTDMTLCWVTLMRNLCYA